MSDVCLTVISTIDDYISFSGRRRFWAVEHSSAESRVARDCYQETPEDSSLSDVPFPNPCSASTDTVIAIVLFICQLQCQRRYSDHVTSSVDMRIKENATRSPRDRATLRGHQKI